MSDHRRRVAVHQPQPADDRGIVAEGAIAMQLDELGGQAPDVVADLGPPGMPGQLNGLPRCGILRNRIAQRFRPRREPRDLLRQVHARLRGGDPLEFVDLPLDPLEVPLQTLTCRIRGSWRYDLSL